MVYIIPNIDELYDVIKDIWWSNDDYEYFQEQYLFTKVIFT